MGQNKKIRIARVITWMPFGGIERKLVDVLPRIDKDRFDVSMIFLRKPGPLGEELGEKGIPTTNIPFNSRIDPSAIRKLAAHLRENQIDLVHSHMYRANVPATIAGRLAGIRHLWSQIHNVDTWETRRQLRMDRWISPLREGIIAVSEQVKRNVIQKLGVKSDSVRVIYNGVDTHRFSRTTPEGVQARDELRRENGVEENEIVMLFAARLVDQKHPDEFLRLAEYLFTANRRGRRFPDVRFWVLGDGPLEDKLKAQAAETSQPDRIKFFGRRDDVQRFMAAADMFIMTSDKEGFSNALLEAMASGLVPVVTDVGGNGEAVRECTDGRVIPPGQFHKLCSAVDRVLGDDRYLKELQASAVRRAEEFSVQSMVSNLEGLYEESVRKAP